MVMVLQQDIPSDQLIHYRRSLIPAVNPVSRQYATRQFGSEKYGPPESLLYKNKYGDNYYHGRPYGAELYPHLARATSAQQGQFVRKRMAHFWPRMRNDSTSSPTAAQRKVRAAFKKCCDCFNIQPWSGGAEPDGTGPYSRTWWYTQAGPSGLWYYDYFIQQSWWTFFAGNIPKWCETFYVHLYAVPLYVETSAGANYETEPFSLHADLYTHGFCNGVCSPLNCVRKKEDTQSWEKLNGSYQKETCCTNYKRAPMPATASDLTLAISPLYESEVKSGLRKDGWDGTIPIVNGHGQVDNLVWTEKDHQSIANEHFTELIEGSNPKAYGNCLLLVNPILVPCFLEGDALRWGRDYHTDPYTAYGLALADFGAADWEEGEEPNPPLWLESVYLDNGNYRGYIEAMKAELGFDLTSYDPNDYSSAQVIFYSSAYEGAYYCPYGWKENEWTYIANVMSYLGGTYITGWYGNLIVPKYPGAGQAHSYHITAKVALIPK